jgi:hypothetical protein
MRRRRGGSVNARPASAAGDANRGEIERGQSHQPLASRQVRHAGVHQDDAGDAPRDEDRADTDPEPSVRVNQELPPVEELPNAHP